MQIATSSTNDEAIAKPTNRADFFISYNQSDAQAAIRIAEAFSSFGYTVRFAEWELKVGDSISGWMSEALDASDRMIAVCSPDYFSVTAVYSDLERKAFVWSDTKGFSGTILPIIVKPCAVPKIIAHYRHIDLTQIPIETWRSFLSTSLAVKLTEPTELPSEVPKSQWANVLEATIKNLGGVTIAFLCILLSYKLLSDEYNFLNELTSLNDTNLSKYWYVYSFFALFIFSYWASSIAIMQSRSRFWLATALRLDRGGNLYRTLLAKALDQIDNFFSTPNIENSKYQIPARVAWSPDLLRFALMNATLYPLATIFLLEGVANTSSSIGSSFFLNSDVYTTGGTIITITILASYILVFVNAFRQTNGYSGSILPFLARTVPILILLELHAFGASFSDAVCGYTIFLLLSLTARNGFKSTALLFPTLLALLVPILGLGVASIYLGVGDNDKNPVGAFFLPFAVASHLTSLGSETPAPNYIIYFFTFYTGFCIFFAILVCFWNKKRIQPIILSLIELKFFLFVGLLIVFYLKTSSPSVSLIAALLFSDIVLFSVSLLLIATLFPLPVFSGWISIGFQLSFTIFLVLIIRKIIDIISSYSAYFLEVSFALLPTYLIAVIIFPIVNAWYDFFSIGMTRYLLRRGSRASWGYPIIYGFIDMLLAIMLFLALCLTTVFVIKYMSVPSVGTLVNFDEVLTGLQSGEKNYYWIYFAFLSTLLPTIFHFAIACFSFISLGPKSLQVSVARLVELSEVSGFCNLASKVSLAILITVSFTTPILLIIGLFWMLSIGFGIFRGEW